MKNHWCKKSFYVSLLGVFLSLPFAHLKVIFFGVPFYFPEIIILVTVAIYFFWCFFSHRTPSSRAIVPDSMLTLGVLLFFLGAVLSFFVNPFSLTGLGMLKSWFIFPLIAAYFVFYEARDPRKRMGFFLAWFIALCGVALVSLVFFVRGELTYDGRLSGTYSSPNFLAFFIAPGIFLAMYLRSLSRSRIHQAFLLLGAGFIGMVIFFTHSYGVFLALFLSSLFYYFVKTALSGWQKKSFFSLGFFIIIFSSVFLLEYGGEKWHSLASFDTRSSLSSRIMIWQSAKKILLDHPIFGIGPGRFQVAYLEYQKYFSPYLEWAVPEPHNFYIAIFLSTGALGFVGFCLFMGRLIFLLAIQVLKKEKESSQALLFSTLLLFFLAYGVTDTPYFKNDLALSFCLFLALAFSSFTAQSDRDACLLDR